MSKQHEIVNLEFEGDWMILSVDGHIYRLQFPQVSERLAKATEAERRVYRVASSGYGIHWPLLDEDLSVDGLIRLAMTQSEAAEIF